MWLFFALLSPFFWAIVHVLDSHCVERVFDKPWMGVITSSLASLIIFAVVPFVAPFVSWRIAGWQIVGIALVAGALIQMSQAFYFQALAYSEAGIVSAYWNLTPTLLPIASFLLSGRTLPLSHYGGIAILVAASVGFCLLDANFKTRWRTFLLMLAASSLQVVALLLEKYVFENSSFSLGFFLVTAGIIIGGLLPLLRVDVREIFHKNWTTLQSAVPIILIIEIANLIALCISQRALALGIPSLVAAVETTTPAYTFMLSIGLLTLTRRFGDPMTWYKLPYKLTIVGCMAVGVWLVS